ncbi:hypothetical protein F5884DRAFT_291932 [Xylogone sp. PMI_703]|nr:hypothetical protein F5884DRAFT_291932 [Xylogone sp. PMI_703]
MRLHSRLGASLLLSLLSLVTVVLLLPRSNIGSKLQEVALSKDYKNLWNWVSQDDLDGGDGLRLVVFGNSWADDIVEEGDTGKGISWVKVLCHEIKCSSYLNFATSRPAQSSPAGLTPPGALMSNKLYKASIAEYTTAAGKAPPKSKPDILPDLASQVQKYVSLPAPNPPPADTIFVVEFGIWDIYYFASLDYLAGQSLTDMSIAEMFRQLDILYDHHYSAVSAQAKDSNSSLEGQDGELRTFRVIIPKLFDPTLLPGWLSQRDLPTPPSSIAEQQKNAVYLTARWNLNLENGLINWVKGKPIDDSGWSQFGDEEGDKPPPAITREIIYYDTDKYLTGILVEHQLQDVNLTDARGLGAQERLFENTYTPCKRGVDDSIESGDVEVVSGQWVCQRPEDYLFWDEFALGNVANEAIGKEVAGMVKNGNTFRASKS